MNLDIDKKENSDYFDLIEKDHASLMKRWNKLSARIDEIDIPSFLVFTVKSDLKKLEKIYKHCRKII